MGIPTELWTMRSTNMKHILSIIATDVLSARKMSIIATNVLSAKKLSIIATIVLSTVTATTPVIAQQTNASTTRHGETPTAKPNTDGGNAKIGTEVGASQRSYQQARRVLDDGIEAMGGLE